MAEDSQPTPGPGWWMASDGNLYPPTESPGVQPTQPTTGPQHCTSCGTTLTGRFCANCGTDTLARPAATTDWGTPPASATAPPALAPTLTPAGVSAADVSSSAPATPAQSGRNMNFVLAGVLLVVLAIFLGLALLLIPTSVTVLGTTGSCGPPVLRILLGGDSSDPFEAELLSQCVGQSWMRAVAAVVLGSVLLTAGAALLLFSGTASRKR
jgi:hypothetical protein